MAEKQTTRRLAGSRRGWGLLFGFSVGAAIGSATGEFALWIAIGMALGVAYEAWSDT